MTIDENLFKKSIAVLARHYGKEISEPIARIYYKHLNEHLNPEEFVSCIELAVIKIPSRFGLPSAEELVELIQGNKQTLAMTEWQTILNAASSNAPENLAYLSQRGHIALDCIGGLRTVAIYEGSMDNLQKQFIQVYCQCSSKDAKTLKPSPQPKQSTFTNYNVVQGEPLTQEQWNQLKEQVLQPERKYKISQIGKKEE